MPHGIVRYFFRMICREGELFWCIIQVEVLMLIGIDLGGTNIAGGLVDSEGMLIYKESVPTCKERTPDEIIHDICCMISSLSNHSNSDIEAVGIGIPGIADPITGDVTVCVNLGWYDVPLKQMISDCISYPIFIDNDATVAGVAEFQIAQKGKYQDAIMITLGTGIGSGILSGGKIVSGAHGIGSEIGHMIVGEGLYTCNCGQNGCLETFASSTAIIHYAKYLMSQGHPTSLNSIVGNDLDSLNGEMIFQQAKAGDAISIQVVDRMIRYLAIGIRNLIMVVDPEVVFIGGGLSMAKEFLIDKLQTELNRIKCFPVLPIATITLAQLQNDAGIIGAAIYGQIRKERTNEI